MCLEGEELQLMRSVITSQSDLQAPEPFDLPPTRGTNKVGLFGNTPVQL